MRRMNLPWRALAAVLLIAGLLLLPAVLNRSAIVYPDTSSYLSAGQHDLDLATAALRHARGEPLPASVRDTAFWTDRSWVYGLFARLLWPLGRFPAIVLAQALWTALALVLCIRAVVPAGPRRRWVTAILLLATPLPIFAAVAIPDAFAGLLAVATALTLTRWRGCWGTAPPSGRSPSNARNAAG